jgi:hypothetical protein
MSAGSSDVSVLHHYLDVSAEPDRVGIVGGGLASSSHLADYLGQGLVLAAVQPDGLHHGGVKEDVIIEDLMDARIKK